MNATHPCPYHVTANAIPLPPISTAAARYHFDYFMPAMLTCFIMMTGGWVDIVGPAYSIVGGSAILFCVSVVIIGCFIVVNLFIAVLLNAFGEDEEEEAPEEEQEGQKEGAAEGGVEGGGNGSGEGGSDEGERLSNGEPLVGALPSQLVSLRSEATEGEGGLANGGVAESDDLVNGICSPGGSLRDPHHLELLRSVISEHRYGKGGADADGSASERAWPEDYTLMCFGPRNSFRQACQRLIIDPRFDQTIVSAIVVSSICLAMDVPRLDPDSLTSHILHYLDYVWTLLFFCEMMSKVIANGFIWGENAYIGDPWNLLDLLIVTVSFLVLLAEFFPMFESLKVLRVLRVLRPLRLLARNPGMKLIIVSLFKSMPAVSNVFGVVIAFQLVFASKRFISHVFWPTLGSLACAAPSLIQSHCRASCRAPSHLRLQTLTLGTDSLGHANIHGQPRQLH